MCLDLQCCYISPQQWHLPVCEETGVFPCGHGEAFQLKHLTGKYIPSPVPSSGSDVKPGNVFDESRSVTGKPENFGKFD